MSPNIPLKFQLDRLNLTPVRARGKSDSQTDRQPARQTDGQTDRQTHRRIVQNHFSRRFGGCTSQIQSYLEVDFLHDANTSIDMEVKPGLKQANTSMSVPPLASYEWAIKHKRNRKTTETQARSNLFYTILGPCPTLGTTASGNFLCKTALLFSYTRMTN